jgi:hypothetical protein
LLSQSSLRRKFSALQITFAAGETAEDAICPSGYTQNNVNLNDGAGGMVIYTCFSKSPEAGLPITNLLAVSGLVLGDSLVS